DQEAWMLTAPSTTTATHATSSTGGDAREKRRSTVSVMMTANAWASTMTNSPTTTGVTGALHLVTLLHARAKNRSASMASGPSPLSCDRLTDRVASALRVSRHMTGTEIQKHGFGSTPRRSRRQVVART